jgi:hypothetical protein
MINIINIAYWHHGSDNCGNGGVVSQVTHCKVENIEFYVRENINGINSFLISSGERWGDKVGKTARKGRGVLELLAPVDQWDRIAALVHAEDTLKRHVKPNRLFTTAWAKQLFQSQEHINTLIMNPNYKELREQLESAKEKVKQARVKYDRKKKQLVKTIQEDTPDLFGEKKSQMACQLFNEPVDPSAVPAALEPFKLEIDNWVNECSRIEGLLLRIETIHVPDLFEKTA